MNNIVCGLYKNALIFNREILFEEVKRLQRDQQLNQFSFIWLKH